MFLPCDNDEEARAAVEKGLAWAALTFPSNYSSALMARVEDGKDVADWDVEFSDVKVVMDMSSMLENIFLYRENIFFAIGFGLKF